MAAFVFISVIFSVFLCPGDSRFIREPVTPNRDITQESLTSDICSECSQIAEVFTDMISNNDTQEVILETLEVLCKHIPEEHKRNCELQLEKHLPKVLQYITGHSKPGEACMALGLCSVHSERGQLKSPQTDTDIDESSSVFDTSTSTQISPQCTLCLFIIKTLENLLPKNTTEDTIVKLMGKVCGLLPDSYEDQCDNFINKYGKKIIDFLLSSAAPHSICTLLQLCLFKDTSNAVILPHSDCQSCRMLAVLIRVHIGLNSTGSPSSTFLQSVCHHHPNAIPKCEVFMKLYGSRLQRVLGNQLDAPDVCERVDLCHAMETLGKDHCTLGPNYWCRDMKTAQKCGNKVFCEKYIWN
ncbi:surfactant protein Bb [Lampris incognitus]|uniref:surfactant protein Bb n=1 Tax=Lampris incognitus TaxID=2546036 RepID=UPI0024B586F6|nr:surfactant protein Bb [Lampris incognitus]